MYRLTLRAAIGAVLFFGTVSSFAADVHWEPLGRSVEERVIEFLQLGQGECHVLVVGALAGNDPLGVELAEHLAAHLARFPTRLAGLKVTIVRDPNPDGRFRRTAANAHGVELDRNFHTQRWRKVSENNRWISGREPESEPETRLLADLLADLKPQRIVVLASSRHAASLGSCGPAESWARQVGNELRSAPQPLDPAVATGSLAVLAGHDLGIATLVLRIPPSQGIERTWTDYKRAVLAAVSPDSNPGAATSPPILAVAPLPAAPLAPAAASDPSKQDPQPKVLTYEELANGTALVPVIGRREAGVVAKQPKPTAPTDEQPSVSPVRLERLPPIDRARPPAQIRHQEPIPFYPDTGR